MPRTSVNLCDWTVYTVEPDGEIWVRNDDWSIELFVGFDPSLDQIVATIKNGMKEPF